MEHEYEIYRKAISTFGANSQVDILIEEMSELTQALIKLRRASRKDPFADKMTTQDIKANVIEEIADVSICLDQAIMIYQCEYEVEEVRQQKILRLEDYIEQKNEANKK